MIVALLGVACSAEFSLQSGPVLQGRAAAVSDTPACSSSAGQGQDLRTLFCTTQYRIVHFSQLFRNHAIIMIREDVNPNVS